MVYADLQVTSNFSFLEGASHADELAKQAASLGQVAIAITDRNSLADIVRAHVACQEKGIRLIVGCRLDLMSGDSLLCFPQDRAAYGRLCELLTLGRRRAPKGDCHLTYVDLVKQSEGQIVIGLPPLEITADSRSFLQHLQQDFPGRAYLALTHFYRRDDAERFHALDYLTQEMGLPVIATNDVFYHIPERLFLQ